MMPHGRFLGYIDRIPRDEHDAQPCVVMDDTGDPVGATTTDPRLTTGCPCYYSTDAPVVFRADTDGSVTFPWPEDYKIEDDGLTNRYDVPQPTGCCEHATSITINTNTLIKTLVRLRYDHVTLRLCHECGALHITRA